MIIPHFEKVDSSNIIAKFSEDHLHRASLVIPFTERQEGKTLCIIGQNPSNADEFQADKTLRYLEQFVFQNLPEYSTIIMLNLYSRIDTKKKEDVDLERDEMKSVFSSYINNNSDFLLVYGRCRNEGFYKFSDKSTELLAILSDKNTLKIDIGTNTNYPPHPGNPKILYRKYEYGVSSFS